MKISKMSVLLPFAFAMCFSLFSAPAHAQASRTWVSGVGDDVNPCSRTAPCKTWAGAISKTANGGEIDALDPGGFGAVTITKSMTIDGGGGQVASTLVAGTNAFVIAATSTDVVTIKNCRIQGLLGNGGNPGGAGVNAIRFTSGAALLVDNCEIYGFSQNGIDFEPNQATNSTLSVQDTLIFNNNGAGILVAPAGGGTATAAIDRTRVYKSQAGLKAQDRAKVTAAFSEFSNNNANGVVAVSSSVAVEINVSNSTIANNPTSGVATAGAGATIRLAYDTITDNGTGINTSGGGTVSGTSPGTNVNAGNTTPGAPNGTAVTLQ
jgi:hypothetical protein